MNSVSILIEQVEGEEPRLTVYGLLGDAVDNASELACLYGWEKIDGIMRWEDPNTSVNYIEVQVQGVQ